MNNFEWDENKRTLNLQKHGIDFIDAIEVFTDIKRIEFECIRMGERRYQIIGIIDELIVVILVYTYRNQKKRIISARSASKKEREIYYSLR